MNWSIYQKSPLKGSKKRGIRSIATRFCCEEAIAKAIGLGIVDYAIVRVLVEDSDSQRKNSGKTEIITLSGTSHTKIWYEERCWGNMAMFRAY